MPIINDNNIVISRPEDYIFLNIIIIFKLYLIHKSVFILIKINLLWFNVLRSNYLNELADKLNV